MLIEINDDLGDRVDKLIAKFPLEYVTKKHCVNKLLARVLDDVEAEIKTEAANNEASKHK